MDPVTKEILTELGKGLKRFGTYTFDDKGADEVMRLEPFVEQLQAMPAPAAAEILFELADADDYEGRGHALASCLISYMQEWDELFDVAGIPELWD